MHTPPARESPPIAPSRKATLLAAGVIVFAALAAYHNSFSVPFVFDDTLAIAGNQTIRNLWPVWPVLSPPATLTVGGRPLANLSLAVNYAWGGVEVRGYHAFNLGIHILAALTLFGIVRRTLLRVHRRSLLARAAAAGLAGDSPSASCASSLPQADAWPLALAAALLWTVHPLQTEAVTYLVQRTESLMGLFYLLTLYGFVRSVESRTPGRWYALSVAACLLGMTSKEVMVSAPIIVLIYDRTFVSGSWREAWRQRRRLYAGLGVTWLVLAGLVFHTGTRGGTAGYGVGVAWWAYALRQLPAITHYLQLAVWPHPLVLDYGTDLAQPTAEILRYALIVAALAAGTVIALRRQPALGYAGVWFFAILAPTSSVVPVATQTMAEHRMYLPLAAAIVLAVTGIHRVVGRRSGVIFLALAVGLGWLTVRRNEDYQSDLSLWRDTVAKCPHNARAHFTLGNVLYRLDRVPEALRQYEAALDINPNHAEAHNSLGNILVRLGRLPEAMAHYERALQLEPDYIQADYNYANALVQAGRLAEAMSHYQQALRLDPQNAEVRNNLGSALLLAGRLPEATGQLQEALRIKPDYAEAHYNLANALAQSGQLPEAIAHYEQALQFKPDYMEARENLARVQALQRAALPEN